MLFACLEKQGGFHPVPTPSFPGSPGRSGTPPARRPSRDTMTPVSTMPRVSSPPLRWRARLHEVIFESDTAAGRAFDLLLLIAIIVSLAAVLLESVSEIRQRHGQILRAVEWTITIAFTIEYVLRLVAVDRPWRYALSFYGLVDLLSIVPTYLALLVPDTQSFMVIRAIRLLRVFRILKAAQFLSEAQFLIDGPAGESSQDHTVSGRDRDGCAHRGRPHVRHRGREARLHRAFRAACTGRWSR